MCVVMMRACFRNRLETDTSMLHERSLRYDQHLLYEKCKTINRIKEVYFLFWILVCFGSQICGRWHSII